LSYAFKVQLDAIPYVDPQGEWRVTAPSNSRPSAPLKVKCGVWV
jgi:hypothetical protein